MASISSNGTSEMLQCADQLLVQYLRELSDKDKDKMSGWTHDFEVFTHKVKQDYVTGFYFQINRILSNLEERNHWKTAMSINYTIPQDSIQKHVIKEVIKEKLEMNPKMTVKYVKPEESLKLFMKKKK